MSTTMSTLVTPVSKPARAPFGATNWSSPEDSFSVTFYDKYRSQLWFPEEIPLTNDALAWRSLSGDERRAYTRASAGLNALDTLQGEVGMAALRACIGGHVRKAVLQFQGMMEDVHARSYSLMNKTFLTGQEEREVFRWVETQPELQAKISFVQGVFENPDESALGVWQKLVVSCLLETALFYSGFFYPLYLAGQGKMVSAGEIFNLIILDEAVHGVYVAMLAAERFETLTAPEKDAALAWYEEALTFLYENELRYSAYLYDRLELTAEVGAFVRFNFNVLADNLGLPRRFPDEEIHPVVRNGIKTHGTTHDFFSAKGNSYTKIAVEPLTDADVAALWGEDV